MPEQRSPTGSATTCLIVARRCRAERCHSVPMFGRVREPGHGLDCAENWYQERCVHREVGRAVRRRPSSCRSPGERWNRVVRVPRQPSVTGVRSAAVASRPCSARSRCDRAGESDRCQRCGDQAKRHQENRLHAGHRIRMGCDRNGTCTEGVSFDQSWRKPTGVVASHEPQWMTGPGRDGAENRA